jgi:dihydroorotate dehydrogenase (NAD+) catalytic subunit
MLNAVGLQNPGARHVLAHELPELTTFFHKPVIANISGFSVDEYREACEMIDQSDAVGLIEVNISCPNVHGGGMSFGSDPKSARRSKGVKEAVKKPVYVKLSPNVTDHHGGCAGVRGRGRGRLSMINNASGHAH